MIFLTVFPLHCSLLRIVFIRIAGRYVTIPPGITGTTVARTPQRSALQTEYCASKLQSNANRVHSRGGHICRCNGNSKNLNRALGIGRERPTETKPKKVGLSVVS